MISEPQILLSRVLVLDESPATFVAIQRALESEGFHSVYSLLENETCEEAFARICPDLIVIDTTSASFRGFEVLKAFRMRRSSSHLPILALVRECSSADRQRAIECGANDFLSGPLEPTEVAVRCKNALLGLWAFRKLEQIPGTLETSVAERTQSLYEAQIEILQCLGRASEYRDDDTGEHTKRVGALAARIAEALGLPEDDVDLIRLAAPLHDIGKIAIRDAVLMKPGKLTESEYTVMKTHAVLGSRILEGGRSPLLQMAEVIARSHHERWDGTGYPSRLVGEDIPLPGRIVAVADVYDALISERSYKAAWSVNRAVEEIKSLSGRHFDPRVVNAFLNVMAGELQIAEAA